MIKKRIKKNQNLWSSKALVIASLSLFFFLILTLCLIKIGIIDSLDNNINFLIGKIQTPFFILLSKIISTIFEPVVFIFLSLFFIFYLYKSNLKKETLAFSTLIIFSFLITQALKLIIERARPLNALVSESTFSFPSGHATMAIIFFGALLFLLDQHIKDSKKEITVFLATIIVIVLIGVSRIYLNVHYLSDVVGGFLLGSFLLSLFILYLEFS